MTTAPLASFAGFRFPRDPFGLATGLRMWRTYNDLNSLSDDSLAARGMTRADIARAAAEIATRG